MTPEELIRELLRGVSFSLSKGDKQRAIQLAQRDEKEVNAYNPKSKDSSMSTNMYYSHVTSLMNPFTPTSRRRYLSMVKNKINDWSNTSNKSISSTGTCGDRSTTSSTTGGNPSHPEPPPQSQQQQSQKQQPPRSPHPSRTNVVVGVGRRLRTTTTRNKLSRNNSNEDNFTTEYHEDTNESNEDDDNHKNSGQNTVTSPKRRLVPNHHHHREEPQQQQQQQQSLRYQDTPSPLSLIQQVVYETSREFEYDHLSNSSTGSA
jgi:hypothetical protein